MDEFKKDTRFAHITKDPRFRPISKTEKKLKIDRRFASMFNDPKFKLKYTVDKRGKPLVKEHTTRDDMNKFYHLEDEESSSSSSDEETENKFKNKSSQSKDDEQLDELLKSDDSDDDDDKEEEEEDEEEIDEDKKSSSSEEDEDIPEADDGTEWNQFDDNCARGDDVSHRLAVCNMDWDRVRAVDIFILLNSWKPPEGVIKSVTIYPSEYGLKQMEAEQKYGPLPGTTKPVVAQEQSTADSGHQSEAEDEPEEPELKSDDDDEEPNYDQDDGEDTTDPVMRERLRKYQLNRLKYYYAVVECDSVATASHIYDECDGLEYETSAVRLDLRFIPDSVTFDSSIPPRDQCTELPDKSSYKPVLFRNTALTQTKVRCTWDETPLDRRRLTRKKYTLEELEKVNLDAYLASESEDELEEEDDDNNVDEGSDDETKKDDHVFKVPNIPDNENKKKSNKPIIKAPSVLSSQDDIDRYRALLLDFDDNSKPDKKYKKKITNFFDEQNSGNEDSNHANGNDDDDDDDASDIDMEITWQPGLKDKGEEKSKKKKNKKQDKQSLVRAQIEDEEEEDSTDNHRETLELLTVDDDVDNKRDYNLRDMIKSHKQSLKAAKKSKKSQKNNSSNVSETDKTDDKFQVNVDDKRFQAIYTRPEFNIDQSDPRFKPTAGTQKLIEEKLKKRKFNDVTSSSRTEPDEDDIVIKLKKKSAKRD